MLSGMTPLLVQTDLENNQSGCHQTHLYARNLLQGQLTALPELPSWTWQPLLGKKGREDQKEKGGKRKKIELGYGGGGKGIGPKKVELGSPSVNVTAPGVVGWLSDCTSN